MKHLSWKYVAGLIDGEGCLDVQITNSYGKHYVRPRVRVCMAIVATDIIEQLKNNYGGSICHREFENPNWSNALSWELTGYSTACMFLRNIANHLILKKEQARFLLWMETNIKGQHVSDECRDAIREELKLLKRDPHRLSERAQERIKSLL